MLNIDSRSKVRPLTFATRIGIVACAIAVAQNSIFAAPPNLPPPAIGGTSSNATTGLEKIQDLRSSPDLEALLVVDTAHDAVYGDPRARVNVIGYLDFSCTYCRELRPVLKRLVNRSKGRINWVFRHFPLSDAPDGGLFEAQAAECVRDLAGSEGFWTYASQLYYLPRSGETTSRDIARRAANATNTDWSAVAACIGNGRVIERIRHQQADAQRLGVTATPTLFLVDQQSGKYRRIDGAVSSAELQRASRALLQFGGD